MNDEQVAPENTPEQAPEQVPEYSFDFSKMEITNNIVELYQEGNFLFGVTDKGVRFRQHIPAGKILSKKGGSWTLQNMEVM